MLTILNEPERRDAETIRSEYPKCKFLLINIDISKLQDLDGNLYCISDSKSSFKEICSLSREFSTNGVRNIIMGDYEDGGALGVQYEYRQ